MKILISGFVGALAVGCGAFGAHALKARLAPDLLAIWNTGAHYHLVHAVALLALALHAQATKSHGGSGVWAWGLMLSGVLVFSGSLYALALSGVRMLGAITPIGGVLLIAGWIAAAMQFRRP
jgi:uncharacterized membrane protein YgdD (TMEM256/DUF423 family)